MNRAYMRKKTVELKELLKNSSVKEADDIEEILASREKWADTRRKYLYMGTCQLNSILSTSEDKEEIRHIREILASRYRWAMAKVESWGNKDQ